MADFEYWCRRTFRKWTLFVPFEEYYSQCWVALMERLPNFDPSIATIQTLCISTANNECWRIYMKNKTAMSHPEDGLEETRQLGSADGRGEAFAELRSVLSSLGIECAPEELEREYHAGGLVGKCLVWISARESGMAGGC